MQETLRPHVRSILLYIKFGHENISTAILPLPLIEETQLSFNKECALSSDKLPMEGLPRNRVVTITEYDPYVLKRRKIKTTTKQSWLSNKPAWSQKSSSTASLLSFRS